MLATASTKRTSWANRMLAMADRLFSEFETLPVRTVFDAITASRCELHEQTRAVAAPEQIEARARERLMLVTGKVMP